MVTIHRLLTAIDDGRQRLGMSKAELARRIGADPSVVRRLLSGRARNPTLKTVVELLTALNIDVELRPREAATPTPKTPEEKPRRSRARKAVAA